MTNPRFPALFNERVHLHFGVGGALTQVNMTYRFRELEAEMKEVIPDMDQFIPDHFIPEREAIVLQAFQTAGVYTP
jgi:hypothetical protein